MKMPVHVFMSMCNILAKQFKEEAEQQKKEQEEAMSNTPNLRQFSDFNSLASNFKMPNLPSIPGL